MTQQQPEIFSVKGDWDSIPGIHRFSHEAMATTFEVIIQNEDGRYAEQAACAAFGEADRLEGHLSRFIGNSDVSRINNLNAGQPLRVGPDAFECLQLSAQVYDETNKAFDITIGPLLSCWYNEDGTSRRPSGEQLNIARQRSGMHLLKLDETEHTVLLLTSPVQIDLGGIGKGFAVDRMAELLREWSIDTALISGGYSSVLALDAPARTQGWPVTLSNPNNRKQTLACLYLQGRAVGASGLQKGRHIIDPRTARPVQAKLVAWACAGDAATADALSTAFMVMGPDEIEQFCERHPDILAMVILQEGGKKTRKEKIFRFGHWKNVEQP